jgi:hypothetical protein
MYIWNEDTKLLLQYFGKIGNTGTQLEWMVNGYRGAI